MIPSMTYGCPSISIFCRNRIKPLILKLHIFLVFISCYINIKPLHIDVVNGCSWYYLRTCWWSKYRGIHESGSWDTVSAVCVQSNRYSVHSVKTAETTSPEPFREFHFTTLWIGVVGITFAHADEEETTLALWIAVADIGILPGSWKINI